MSTLSKLLVPVLAALALTAAPAVAKTSVPAGWLGVQADGPLFNGEVDLGQEVATMKASGVGAVRLSVFWDAVQPYASADKVPADEAGGLVDEGGRPTDWRKTDLMVSLATQQGIGILPVVQRAPRWARKHPKLTNSPPSKAGNVAYAQFLTALIHRYGPGGAFWVAHPELPAAPLRAWQVWNEPDGVRDWSDQPGIKAYMSLLKGASQAIRAADPGAQVVLAGLVGRSWEHLDEVYRRGGRKLFDAAAIHPFSLRVTNVMKILRLSRGVMRDHGDKRKPLLVTELSWPSAKGKTKQQYGFEVSEKGQALKLKQAVREIARDRRKLGITALFWSTWMSYDRDPTYSFDYAGLRRFKHGKIVAKPAFYAFRKVATQLSG